VPQLQPLVAPTPSFANPVLPAPAQDPHVLWHRGLYYYCESSPDGIFVRVARHFLDLAYASRRQVWAPAARGPASRNVWAPEIHVIDGRCVIYFAADDGRNANHRMWVLSALTSDPAGAYGLRGPLDTGGWAIDGTVLTDPRGERVFLWSGWPGRRNGRQNLYGARMRSPFELSGPRVLLAEPEHDWECHGLPICEGPQVLQRGGRTFIVYSASGSWTEHYCLGLLAHEGGDYLDPRRWRKAGPVFQQNAHGWGVGHCGFVTAPDGADWMLYHAKTSRRPGWADREVRAQPFSWRSDGTPFFGAPVSLAASLARPESRRRPFARSA
jgi:GH43 family beta-xylosidase